MSFHLPLPESALNEARENMDPHGLRSDAELNDALQLIQNSASSSHSLRDKFRLEAPVMADGHNFSAGEKQLRKRFSGQRRRSD